MLTVITKTKTHFTEEHCLMCPVCNCPNDFIAVTPYVCSECKILLPAVDRIINGNGTKSARINKMLRGKYLINWHRFHIELKYAEFLGGR